MLSRKTASAIPDDLNAPVFVACTTSHPNRNKLFLCHRKRFCVEKWSKAWVFFKKIQRRRIRVNCTSVTTLKDLTIQQHCRYEDVHVQTEESSRVLKPPSASAFTDVLNAKEIFPSLTINQTNPIFVPSGEQKRKHELWKPPICPLPATVLRSVSDAKL